MYCTHIGMSGYCDVPWIGQDSSKSKGEGKLVPVNAIKEHGEGTGPDRTGPEL